MRDVAGDGWGHHQAPDEPFVEGPPDPPPRELHECWHRFDPAAPREVAVAAVSACIQQVLGTPGEIRTPDPQVRSLTLYPAELRAQRHDR